MRSPSRSSRGTGIADAVSTTAADQLARRIKEGIGPTVDVTLVAPGELPRSEGKLKRLYDLR